MNIPVVELSDCILCGVCHEACPSVFKIRDEGYVEVADLPEYPQAEVNEAIRDCPKDCIYWENND